jgi:glycosyltransferase involved in cell wall biosynthesis
MRRLLMITHAFPPTGGSGVQRTAKFARYLPEFGWSPIVWSADRVAGLPRDETLVDESGEGLDVRRRRAISPLGILGNWSQPSNDSAGAKRRRSRLSDGIGWRLRNAVDKVSSLVIPDKSVLWAVASYPALRRIIRRERVDAIYSTYSPPSNHLLALWMSRLGHLPWVADFRDLWTDNYDFGDVSSIHRGMHVRLERKVLERADAVVGVSPDQTRILANHVPQNREKFLTIPNGADPNDFASVNRSETREDLGIASDKFVLSYVGSFVATAEACAIVDGVASFVRRVGSAKGSFEFRIVGWIPDGVKRHIEASRISPVTTGYVSHREAIREIVAADCLVSGNLVAGNNCDSVVPAKVFEYMASGVPMLHVGALDGATDRFIRDADAGVTVLPDAAEIDRTIEGMWRSWTDGAPRSGCSPQSFSAFTRQTQTQQLAAVLDRCVAATAAKQHPASDGAGPQPKTSLRVG